MLKRLVRPTTTRILPAWKHEVQRYETRSEPKGRFRNGPTRTARILPAWKPEVQRYENRSEPKSRFRNRPTTGRLSVQMNRQERRCYYQPARTEVQRYENLELEDPKYQRTETRLYDQHGELVREPLSRFPPGITRQYSRSESGTCNVLSSNEQEGAFDIQERMSREGYETIQPPNLNTPQSIAELRAHEKAQKSGLKLNGVKSGSGYSEYQYERNEQRGVDIGDRKIKPKMTASRYEGECAVLSTNKQESHHKEVHNTNWVQESHHKLTGAFLIERARKNIQEG